MTRCAQPDNRPAAPVTHPAPTRSARQHVIVITASVGAGHDGPAREITTGLRRAGHEAAVVDLVELAPWRLGRLLRLVFRWQLTLAPRRWGHRFDAADRTAAAPWFLRAIVGLVGRRLASLARAHDTDLIVSTFPFGALVVAAGRPHGIGVPLVTYVTDPAAHAIWAHPTTSRYLVTAASAADDLRRHGPAGVTVVRPAVGAGFRPATGSGQKRRLRRSLGLPDGPLVLLTSGSWGVGDVARSARELRDIGVTPLVVCGRNARLQRSLADDAGVIAWGWSDRMSDVMRACDAVVLNSGGLTLMEALTTGVPVLHYRPLPGQGAANAIAAERAGLARWPRDRSELAGAVHAAIAAGARSAPATTAHPGAPLIDVILAACDVTGGHASTPIHALG